MQESTRFIELENVVLIPENYTQEIQKNLEVFHSSKMFGSFELEDYFQKHQDIGFLHYEAMDKEVIERLEYQIGKVSKDVNYGYAYLSIGNVKNARSVFIKDIEYEFVAYFQLMHSDSENQFWHAHKFNLKYSDYEIVYCIAEIFCGCFGDNKVFKKEYNRYKGFFSGTEEEFLDCFLYPKKVKGYGIKYIENITFFSDLNNKLEGLKNNLFTDEENNNVTTPNDNQWIKDIVKEKYKYYGFEEHIGLNYDFPFMEHKKGDIDFNNQKWACVNWYVRNLNTVHRDLLNNLEMLPKEKVKEQIVFAYNKQIEVFQDWDLRKGVYVEYFNSMEKLSKSFDSQTLDGYYDIYRLKWLFISSCFIKFYKVILDKYFLEKSEAPIPPATGGGKPKAIKEKPVISFKTMFINPSEYDKVLGYVGEYLTETNQWKGSIIYLSAFYGVLRDRGYLNKIYKAPQINSTLKNEFNIESTTTDKNFQSDKINNAVATYAEAFNMIPSLKSTK